MKFEEEDYKKDVDVVRESDRNYVAKRFQTLTLYFIFYAD
jgi:hypothetical protein